MADFRAAAPVEPEKLGAYLHDRDNRPKAPETRRDISGYVRPVVLGVLFTLGFAALMVEDREGWTSHRDWVIPFTIQFGAIAGVALGYLVNRQKWSYVIPGFISLIVIALLSGGKIWRREYIDRADGLADALSIIIAIMLAITVAVLVFAAIRVELKEPTRAPEPQL